MRHATLAEFRTSRWVTLAVVGLLALSWLIVDPGAARAETQPLGAGVATGNMRIGETSYHECNADGLHGDESGPGLRAGEDGVGKVFSHTAVFGYGTVVGDRLTNTHMLNLCGSLVADAAGSGPGCHAFGGTAQGRLSESGAGGRPYLQLSGLSWDHSVSAVSPVNPLGVFPLAIIVGEYEAVSFEATGSFEQFDANDVPTGYAGEVTLTVVAYNNADRPDPVQGTPGYSCFLPDGMSFFHTTTVLRLVGQAG